MSEIFQSADQKIIFIDNICADYRQRKSKMQKHSSPPEPFSNLVGGGLFVCFFLCFVQICALSAGRT